VFILFPRASFRFSLPHEHAFVVVAAVSVTVAADNLKTIKNTVANKTDSLQTLSTLMEKYSMIAGAILLATACSQFFCVLTMWWYDNFCMLLPLESSF
jgi:hypothetical protein